MSENPVVLVTGGARRIGASISKYLHENGYNVVVHYRTSEKDALELVDYLNCLRPSSSVAVQADLSSLPTQNMAESLINKTLEAWKRLDLLVNNASVFFPTDLEHATEEDWDSLLTINLKAPYFLAKAAVPHLSQNSGSIINISDINAKRPAKGYSQYCITKAGLVMMTKALAKDLAPTVRVNSVSPGVIILPENKDMNEEMKAELIGTIPLNKMGDPMDISKAVKYLACDAPYITGHDLIVDGGKAVCK